MVLHLCIGIVWLNFGNRGDTGVTPVRSCWKVPSCPPINTILLIPPACFQESSLQWSFELFFQFMIRSTSCLSTYWAMARNFYCLESWFWHNYLNFASSLKPCLQPATAWTYPCIVGMITRYPQFFTMSCFLRSHNQQSPGCPGVTQFPHSGWEGVQIYKSKIKDLWARGGDSIG